MKNRLLKLIDSPRLSLYICSVLIILFHFFIPLDVGDDSWFSEILAQDKASVATWAQYLRERYMLWTSRLATESLLIVLLRYPWLFRLSNALVAVAALFLFENITNPEHARLKNLIISVCFFLYPLWLFGEAGWAATSLTYLWTLTAALLALRPAVLELQNRTVRNPEYAVSLFALCFGAFQEQICAILILLISASAIYRFFAQKRIPVYQISGLIIGFIMLIYILTCPGNDNRTVLETQTWFPEYESFSLFKRLEIGFSSMTRSVFLEPTVITPVFCLILAVAVALSQRQAWKRIVGCVPLVFSLLFGLIGWLLRDTASPLSYFYRSVTKEGTGFDILSPMTWFADFVFIIVLASVIISLRFAIKDNLLFWLSFLLLGTGAASRIAIGLSPTVWASGNRTCIFLYLTIDIVMAFLLFGICNAFAQKNNPDRKKPSSI